MNSGAKGYDFPISPGAKMGEMPTLKSIVVFPCWLLAKVILLFEEGDHPWKRKNLAESLSSFSRGATPLCVQFGIYFWLAFLIAAISTARFM